MDIQLYFSMVITTPAFNYNYKYVNGFKREKKKFLDYLEHLSQLFIYVDPKRCLDLIFYGGKRHT